MTGAMVFHHPLPLVPDGASGSRVRPYRMARAFEELGLEVVLATGYSRERRRAMAAIRDDVRRGRQFLFVYSETSTMPIFLTDPSHVPLHPLQDVSFFRWMSTNGVPVGLFYRDAHWRFDHYRTNLAWYKRWVEVPFYHLEWVMYRRAVDHLFLPASAMARALPSGWEAQHLSPLPPGAELHDHGGAERSQHGELRLLYVGGVTPPLYDLRPLLETIQDVGACSLTLCCREEEWARVRDHYRPIDEEKVRILHLQGSELADLYHRADIFAMVWDLHPYYKITVPVKLPEALGFGLPVVTTRGTEAGRIVEEEGVGWTVGGAEELKRLLTHLRESPHELEQKRAAVLRARERHTWTQRARQVVETMAAYRRDAR